MRDFYKLNVFGDPYVKMDITFDYQGMLEEARALDERYHSFSRSPCKANAHWSAICLHGSDESHIVSWKRYFRTREEWEDKLHWTPASQECPKIMDFLLHQFPKSDGFRCIRLMRLGPGGHIDWHIDRSDHSIWAINFALNTPEECHMETIYNGMVHTVPLDQGSAVALSPCYDHRVINNSDEARYHLIVHHSHGPVTPEINEFYWRSYHKFLRYNPHVGIGMTGKVLNSKIHVDTYGNPKDIEGILRARGYEYALIIQPDTDLKEHVEYLVHNPPEDRYERDGVTYICLSVD